MKMLAFDTKAEAEDRSREEWEKVLGRKKRPEDVTEFLWSVEATPDGKAALAIPDADVARLAETETLRLTTVVEIAVDEPIAVDETVRGR